MGYYVNSEYTEEELRENPPETIDITKVGRSILSDKPRVTRFQVDFDNPVVRHRGYDCLRCGKGGAAALGCRFQL